MPRGYNNYSFVIDSSFQPFTMQEMLVPFTAYKDAYEKMEESYFDLSDKADKFKYLSETLPEGSKARGIYEGYANDLKTQADDLAKNGLGMGNRRALNSLKRRYQGEIGRLVEADAALKKEQELRRQMNAKDASMLYADDNLTIDRFLDNNTPNLYSISGNDLYTRGAAAGQAASKRVYGAEDAGSTLGGYYRDYVQRMGYTPEQLRKFGEQISADFANWAATNIPELGMAANQILEANGVTENFKYNPNNLRKAQQQVIRGLIDGAVYSEQHNPKRDLGKLTQSEQTSFALQRENMNRQAAAQGLTWNGKEYVYNPDKDPSMQNAKEVAKIKAQTKTSGGKGSSSEYGVINQQGIRVSWRGNTPNPTNGDTDNDVATKPLDKEAEYTGKAYEYDDLPQYAKNHVDRIIGNKGNFDNYIYFFKPFEGGLFNDSEAELDIVPRKVMKDNSKEEEEETFDFGS